MTPNPPNKPVLLLGATGFTGQLTARALLSAGVPFVAGGRCPDRLAGLNEAYGGALATRLVDVTNGPSLLAAVAEAGVVASTAGPFTDMGPPVVSAAIEAGVPYLDCTGEQGFIASCRSDFARKALDATVPVINAFAFEYALADWLCALAADGRGSWESIEVFYRLGPPCPTRGTYLSMKAQATAPSVCLSKRRFVEKQVASETKSFRFPGENDYLPAIWVPFGEVINLPAHIDVVGVDTYLARPRGHRRFGHLAAEEKSPQGVPHGPNPGQRASARFVISARLTTQDVQETWSLEGKDPYGVTAKLMAWGAAGLQSGAFAGEGVLTPAQLVPHSVALPWLKDACGIKVVGP